MNEQNEPPMLSWTEYTKWYARYQKLGYDLPYPAPRPQALDTITPDELATRLLAYTLADAALSELGRRDMEAPGSVSRRMVNRASAACERAANWFEERGIPEDALLYDEETKRYQLPPNWR